MIRFPPRRILVAVDLSAPSAAAWKHASAWGKRFGARLKAVHVQAPPPLEIPAVVPGIPGGARALRRDLSEELSRLTGGPRVWILEGEPVVALIRLARTWKADLVIMGTHGRTGLERLVLGSVAEAMVRESPIPVLVVQGDPRDVRAVLAPVNFTPHGERAFTYAAAVAAAFSARLAAHHVAAASTPVAEARADVERLVSRLPEEVRAKCSPRASVGRGEPAEAIAKAARSCDLVVLAAHHRGLVRDAVFGMTVERVMRGARTALLSVPTPQVSQPFSLRAWSASRRGQTVR